MISKAMSGTRHVRRLTKSFMRSQRLLAWIQVVPQALVGAVCDGWIYHKNQARLQSSPQACPPVLTINHVFPGRDQALSLVLAHSLLPRRHDRYGYREELGNGACHSAQGQLNGGAWGCVDLAVREVERPHDGVPVKVGKVGRSDADKGAEHARVESRHAVGLDDLCDGIDSGVVVLVVGGIGSGGGGGALHLDLEPRLDTGARSAREVIDGGHDRNCPRLQSYGKLPEGALTCLMDTPAHLPEQHRPSLRRHYPMAAGRPPLIVQPLRMRDRGG